jgi:hypothetical protein
MTPIAVYQLSRIVVLGFPLCSTYSHTLSSTEAFPTPSIDILLWESTRLVSWIKDMFGTSLILLSSGSLLDSECFQHSSRFGDTNALSFEFPLRVWYRFLPQFQILVRFKASRGYWSCFPLADQIISS